MALSPAVRVGILVFLFFVALISVYFFLKGYAFFSNRYNVIVTFDNALGIMQGAEVRMAGVPIGQVASVSLDSHQRARLLLDINSKYCIPVGSQFAIQSGVLITQQSIEVIPNRRERQCLPSGAHVIGQKPVLIEDLFPRAEVILDNLAAISKDLRGLIGNQELQKSIVQSAKNVQEATEKLNRTLALVQGTVLRSQDRVDAIVSNLKAASLNVRSMTADLESLVSEPRLHEDIRETVASARRSAETLEQTIASIDRSAASVEKLVTNPEFQENIRATVADARAAAQEAKEAVGRVNRIFGGGEGRHGVALPTRGLSMDLLYVPSDDRIRAELTTAIPLPDDRFLTLGLFDVGVSNKVILQAGQPFGSRTDFRYGLYASRLGVGLDHGFSSKMFGRLDLYDTENLKLNMRAGYRVNKDSSVLLGVDDLFGDNKATVGVQLAK